MRRICSRNIRSIGSIVQFFERRRIETAAVAQSNSAFAPEAEGWVFESQSRQTEVVITGSDISTGKRSAIGVSVTGSRKRPL